MTLEEQIKAQADVLAPGDVLVTALEKAGFKIGQGNPPTAEELVAALKAVGIEISNEPLDMSEDILTKLIKTGPEADTVIPNPDKVRPITVILRDEGNKDYEQVLIYWVTADPDDEDAVFEAVCEQREADLGELSAWDREKIIILFAFEGHLSQVTDWRN